MATPTTKLNIDVDLAKGLITRITDDKNAVFDGTISLKNENLAGSKEKLQRTVNVMNGRKGTVLKKNINTLVNNDSSGDVELRDWSMPATVTDSAATATNTANAAEAEANNRDVYKEHKLLPMWHGHKDPPLHQG